MDKIWYRNPSKSEVIGRCGGDKKNEWPRRTDKSRTLKKIPMTKWTGTTVSINVLSYTEVRFIIVLLLEVMS